MASSLYPHVGLCLLALCAGFFGSFGWVLLILLGWLGFAVWSSVEISTWPRSLGMEAMAVYALLLYASPWWSSSYYLSWQTGLILVALPLAFLAWQFVPDPERVWCWLRLSFLPFCWIFALWGLASVLIEGRPRALGPVADPNVYAGFVNLLWFPLVAECFRREGGFKPDRHGLMLLLSLALLSLAFFAATSRGAALAWLAMLALALWVFRKYPGFRKTAFLVLLVSGLAYAAVYTLFNLEIAGRMSEAVSGSDGAASLRFDLWQRTWEMFLSSPLLGSGLGTWFRVYPAYRTPVDYGTFGYYAHNDYLQLAQEGGLVLFATFLLVAAYTLWLAWRVLRLAQVRRELALEAGLMLAVGTVYLQAAVNFMFYLVYVSVWTGFYLGRVAQSMGTARLVKPPKAIAAAPGQFSLLVVLILLVPIAQISIQGLSNLLLNGESKTLSVLQRVAPSISAYKVASAITAIWPNEYVAQRYVVESQAQALQHQTLPMPVRTALLEDTISRYESLRKAMANDPDLAVAEARLWLDQMPMVSEMTSVQRARKLANEALDRDPRHVDGIRMLATTYFSTKDPKQGYLVLEQGMRNALFVRDRLILQAEWLVHRAPENAAALGEIQRNLKELKAGCRLGECSEHNMRVEKLATAELARMTAGVSR